MLTYCPVVVTAYSVCLSVSYILLPPCGNRTAFSFSFVELSQELIFPLFVYKNWASTTVIL